MNFPEEKFDVCIIGAGVVGAAMAVFLGRSGKKVAVVEKNMAEQDRIIGELLQPGGVDQLKNLGLSEFIDNIDAQPVNGYALFLEGKDFKISYPKDKTGYGFRNGKFVQEMRNAMYQIPNVQVFEGSANDFIYNHDEISGIRFTEKGSESERSINAHLTIVCDGAFSTFRESLNRGNKSVSGYFLGLVLKNCKLTYPGHGHVIIAKPSPVLCYPIGSHETRVLIDFRSQQPPKKSEELIQHLNHVIGPQMPESIQPSFYEAVNEGKFKVMPNHLLAASPQLKTGAVLIGDSLNMRHPLTGGGMTVALTDISNLGNRLIGINDFSNHDLLNQSVSEFYKTRHAQNATINILADALYGVMSNEDLKHACYDYLQRGGHFADEPISILSAVSRDFNLLIRHFFSVAFYGSGNIIKKQPTPAGMRRSYRMIKSAAKIVTPLVLNEKPKGMTKTLFRTSKAVFGS